MLHIIERFFLHFACSCFITLVFFFALRFWVYHNAKVGNWLSSRKEHLLVVAALCVFALLPIREPFDVYFGTQVWYKAIFDQISWLIGPAVSVWGLSRYDKI